MPFGTHWASAPIHRSSSTLPARSSIRSDGAMGPFFGNRLFHLLETPQRRKRTKVADLNLKKERPYRRQRSYEPGVLEKPTFSSELIPIKITPIENARSPLYVKPRVEVGPSVLQNGEGELYLWVLSRPNPSRSLEQSGGRL